MKLIVGLGNPGSQYTRTRHNVGFLVIDVLAKRLGVGMDRKKFDGAYAEAMYRGEKIRLLKPETYMNCSGGPVAKAARNGIDDWEDLLVIVDDANLPLGRIRLRGEGSAGGHNGLKSIIEHIGTDKYARLRIGVGGGEQKELSGHVLGKFRPDEADAVEEMILRAADAAEMYMSRGLEETMSRYNRQASKKKE